MIKKERFPKIFFGWWTVLASGFIAMWGLGCASNAMSALFKPIASELGLTRAATSVAASFTRFEGGFESLATGWLSDRFGPRWLVIFGVFLIGLGLILMNFVDSLWAYYVAWGVIAGSGVNIALTLPLDKAITNWFVKKRGLAISVRWVFVSCARVLVLPLVAWLITIQGWRMTCVIGGLVMWLVGLPLAMFFIKQHRPEYYGLLPDGATVEEEAAEVSQMIGRGIEYAASFQETEFTLRQAMRTPTCWLLLVGVAGFDLFHSVFLLHSIPFLTDMGIDLLKAALILGITSLVTIPTRLVGGLLVDRVKIGQLRFILGGSYLLQAIGITAFLLNQTMAMVYVWFILYYFGLGIGVPLASVVRARYFGRKAFGSIQGISSLITTPFVVLAPIYAGWIYDNTGSYITAFTLFATLLAFSAVFPCFALPPKPPAEVTDVHKFM